MCQHNGVQYNVVYIRVYVYVFPLLEEISLAISKENMSAEKNQEGY